jgi:hypothetical protein
MRERERERERVENYLEKWCIMMHHHACMMVTIIYTPYMCTMQNTITNNNTKKKGGGACWISPKNKSESADNLFFEIINIVGEDPSNLE